MATNRNFMTDTLIVSGTWVINELNETHGATSTVTSANVNDDVSYQNALGFAKPASSSISGTSFPVSINILALSGSVSIRYRIERRDGNSDTSTVLDASPYSTAVTSPGINTQTLTLDTAWADTDWIHVTFQAIRTGGHGNVAFDMSTDANSYVDITSTETTPYTDTLTVGTKSTIGTNLAIAAGFASLLDLSAYAYGGENPTFTSDFVEPITVGLYEQVGTNLGSTFGSVLSLDPKLASYLGENLSVSSGYTDTVDGLLYSYVGQNLSLQAGESFSDLILVGTYDLAGTNLSIASGISSDLTVGTFDWAGADITVDVGAVIQIEPDNFTYSGQTVEVAAGWNQPTDPAIFTYQGQDISVNSGYETNLEFGTELTSGTDLALATGFASVIDPAIYNTAGTNFGLAYGFSEDLEPLNYTTSGIELTLLTSDERPFSFASSPAVYSTAGTDLVGKFGSELSYTPSSYSYIEQDLSIRSGLSDTITPETYSYLGIEFNFSQTATFTGLVEPLVYSYGGEVLDIKITYQTELVPSNILYAGTTLETSTGYAVTLDDEVYQTAGSDLEYVINNNSNGIVYSDTNISMVSDNYTVYMERDEESFDLRAVSDKYSIVQSS